MEIINYINGEWVKPTVKEYFDTKLMQATPESISVRKKVVVERCPK